MRTLKNLNPSGPRLVTPIVLWAGLTALSCSLAVDDPVGAGGTPATGGIANTAGIASSGSPASAGSPVVPTAGTNTGGSNEPAMGGTPSAGSGGAPGSSGSGGNANAGGSAGSAGSGSGGTGPGTTNCSSALFCDDFESYTDVPAGPWKVTKQGSGTVTVDTMHAKSGMKAAHFRGTPNKDTVYMAAQDAPVFPITGGDTIYLRFMLYVDTWATPAAGQPMHERLAWIGSSAMLRNTANSGYTFATYNGIAIERINSGYFRDTSQAMTGNNTKQWVCWEMELDNKGGPIQGGSGTLKPHIWRNDTELKLAASGSAETWNPVPWDMLQFSLFTYQASTVVVDFWLDDVAMSKTKIGCPK